MGHKQSVTKSQCNVVKEKYETNFPFKKKKSHFKSKTKTIDHAIFMRC